MKYTEKWLPLYSPLAANLANWKALYNEMNAHIEAAGLIPVDDGGTIEIDDVTILPANNTYAGYRLYAFDDALQDEAPVIIKIEYGCGKIGLTSSSGNPSNAQFPRVRISASVNGNVTEVWTSPTGYNTQSGSPNHPITILPGSSYIVYDPDKGFFGLCNGADSYYTTNSSNSDMRGAVATFFIGRTSDEHGQPTADGIFSLGPNLIADSSLSYINLWGIGNYQPAKGQYQSTDGSYSTTSDAWAPRVGGIGETRTGGQIQVQKVFYQDPQIKVFPWLVTYSNLDIPDGVEFDVEVFPGVTHRFVALGNRTSLGVDSKTGNKAAFAMVFD